MPATTPFQIATLVWDKKVPSSEAIRIAQRAGIDYLEVSKLIGTELEGDLADLRVVTREQREAQAKVEYRVTARGIPHKDARGNEFKAVFAGRHRWTRSPTETSTHDLTESQLRDVKRKADKGSLFVIHVERLHESAPAPATNESKRRN